MKIENNLGTEDVKGLVFRLALPSMLAQFVSVLYSIVDRMYIGNIPQIGEKALAGVGVCGPIVTLISSVAFLVGIGGAPVMSIRLGEKNERAASQILANCFLMLLLFSVFITALVFLLKDKLLMWFGASQTTFVYADSYFSIYILGTVFALLSVGMNQFIICQGFAKIGMKSVIIGALFNIALDPVFIFALKMGVTGAAAATVLSQLASCIYVLKFLFSDEIPIKIKFGKYDWNVMKRVLSIGMTPFIIIALDNVLIISLNTMIQRCGGEGRGDMLMTCATIVQSFMLLVTMPLGGITSGTQTILGYNYGARRPDKIKKAMKYILIIALIFTSAMMVVSQLLSKYFVMMFTHNEAYIELTVWAIKVYTLGIIPLAAQYTIIDGLTGMGIAKTAILLSMFRKILFLTGVFIIPPVFGITNVFFTEVFSDIIGPLVTIIVFLAAMEKILPKSDAARAE